MKKDFEQAYRELARSEAPDLWDRIEANLTEKSAPSEDRTGAGKRRTPYFLRRYALAAAAVLCLAVLVPVMGSITGVFDKSASSRKEAAMDASGKETGQAADAGAEEMGAGLWEAPDGEITEQAEDTAAPSETFGAESAAVPETPQEESTAEQKMMQEFSDAMNQKESRVTVGDRQAATEAAEEDSVIYHVILEIVERKEDVQASEKRREGTYYGFRVETAADILIPDTEYVLFVPADSEELFYPGERYEADLAEEEGVFVPVRNYGQPGQTKASPLE